MATPPRPGTFSEQIRAAVGASGLSRYRICKEIGIAEATMSRFMNGKGGLSMASLDRLAELLSLEVKTRRRK
jgi:transcriptional regulator with XRE-family HTH domain